MARLRIETAPEVTVLDEAFVVKAASGATAPLVEFKDSTGNVVANIAANGILNVTSVVASNAGTGSTALATRAYVDSVAAGLNWHDAVSLTTTAALPTCTYNNGTLGVGAYLEASANGILSVDGFEVTNTYSILVKNQADAKQNGIYRVDSKGAAGSKWKLIRRTDSDNSVSGQVRAGDAIYTVSGTTNIGQGFILITLGTGTSEDIVFGTDSLTFTQFTGTSSFTAGAGLVVNGNELSIATYDNSAIVISQDYINLGSITVSSTTGSNTTQFLSNISVDTYGRVTGVQSSGVSFTGYAPLNAPAFTGNATASTAVAGANTTQIATTAFVATSFAPLASPTLTGTPSAPTAVDGTQSAQIATTQFVANAASTAYSNALSNASSTYIAKSLVTTKGDVIVATASATPARLGVGTNSQILRANSSTTSGLEWGTISPVITLAGDLTGNVTLTNLGNATLTATIAADSVALGTDTTGNYVSDVSGGTGIIVTHTPGEGSTPSVAINTAVTADLTTAQTMSNKTMASPIWTTQATTTSSTFSLINTTATTVNFAGGATTLNIGNSSGNTSLSGNLTVGGSLIVNGTNTIINANTLVVTDKNIEMANVVTQTNTTADGGGILLHGATDKTFYWYDATKAWTSSEDLDLVSGKVYKINNTTVLTSTQVLGKAVPSGTIVGTSDTQVLSNKSFTGGITYNGSTSGTVLLQANATAGTTTITLPATTGTVVTTGDTGTVTSTMISDGTIVNADISSTAAIDPGKIADTTLNQQTTSYTLVLTDKNKMVEVSNASATTLTVPADNTVNMATGATLTILQTGAGQVTIAGASGVTVSATPGLKLRTQWSSATLIKRAANTWVALGDLSA
jgi:hypothetical protein